MVVPLLSESESLLYCQGVVRRHDYDRYLMSLMAGGAARRGVLALLAFNVEVARTPEVATEFLLGEMRLQFWRDVLAEIFRGHPPRQHPVALELAYTINKHMLEPKTFERMLVARHRELNPNPPASLADLEAFVCNTSGDLLALASLIIGGHDDAMIKIARDVGIAYGICGLLRAVPFHAAQRRLYLPADLMQDRGVRAEEVFSRRSSEGLKSIVVSVATVAQQRLTHAQQGVRELGRRSSGVFILGALAGLDLNRLREVQHDPFSVQLQTQPMRRFLRMGTARITGRI